MFQKYSASRGTVVHFSLKRRILSLFFTLIFLSFLGFSTLTGNTIYHLVDNKITANYKSNLDQTCVSIQNILQNLSLVSQRLAYESELQKQLAEYLSSTAIRKKNSLYNSLSEKILYTTFSNADIGLFYYYNPMNSEIFLNNLPLPQNAVIPERTNILTIQNEITYYAPSASQTRFNGNTVIALKRRITTLDGGELFLYVESGYSSMKQILTFNSNNHSYLVFLDKDYNLVYDNLPEPLSFDSGALRTGGSAGHNDDYYWFQQGTKQKWTVVSVIPSSIYEQETRFWKMQILFIALVFALIAVFFGLILWKMVYTPLRIFDRQLDFLLSEQEDMELSHTNIPEYDYLLNKLKDMKKQISSMIGQIVSQEKQYARIEIEKLRYQINPHFLMNTLNLLHWMAVMNDQKEIDSVTQSLNRLLSYNLDKTGLHADLEQELGAAAEYIAIQKTRYDITYSVIKEPENAIMDYPCPKFILQPLLENAIYHGYREGMSLTLRVLVHDKIQIQITDTGFGMPPEAVQKLKRTYQDSSDYLTGIDYPPGQRLGIGLHYVFQSIRDFYREGYEFDITSEPGNGTSVTLILPKLKGGGYLD